MDKDPTLNMLEVKPNLEPVFEETTIEQGQNDFFNSDSEHRFESETDKRLREISETVVEMEKANKEQIESELYNIAYEQTKTKAASILRSSEMKLGDPLVVSESISY